MRKIFSWLIIVIIGIGALCYIRKHPEEFSFLRTLSFADIATLFTISLVIMFFMGLKTKIYMTYFGARLRFVEWFGLEFVASLINYLPLRGGFLSKALYLKKHYDVPYVHFTTFLTALNLITLFCLGIVGLLSMGILAIRYSIHNFILSMLLGTSIAVALLIFFFPFKIVQKKSQSRWISFIVELIQEWNTLKKSKSTVCKLFLAEVAIILSGAAKVYFLFKIIALPLAFFACIIVSSFSSLSTFVPFIPASLGVKEAAMSITASVIGSSLKEGIVVSLIDRAIAMIVLFLFGGLFFYALFGKKARIRDVLPS